MASSLSENETDTTDSDIEANEKYLGAVVSLSGKPTTSKPKRAKILNDKLAVSLSNIAKLSDRNAALVLILAETTQVQLCYQSVGLPYEEIKSRLEKKLQKLLRRSLNQQFL